MARIFGVKELEARRKALAAESDVYRQTLMLEARNLRICLHRSRQRFRVITSPSPLVSMLLPVLISFWKMRRRKRSWKGRIFSSALIGWQLYKRLAPLLLRIVQARFARRSATAPETPEARHPAANI